MEGGGEGGRIRLKFVGKGRFEGKSREMRI